MQSIGLERIDVISNHRKFLRNEKKINKIEKFSLEEFTTKIK